MSAIRWLSVLALAVLGCTKAPEPSPVPLDVLIDGCDELRPADDCELSESRVLTFFVPADAQVNLSVLGDGSTLPFDRTRQLGGEQVKLRVPAGIQRVTVRSGTRERTLHLRRTRKFAPLDAANVQMRRGALAEALATLTPYFGAQDQELAARALDLAGRVNMQRGDMTAALTLLERASAVAHDAGLRRLSSRARLVMAFIYEYRVYALQRALEALAKVDQGLAIEAGWTIYHRAVISFLRGDARAAFELCAQARVRAQQLDHRYMAQTVGELELLQLAELGRLREARAIGASLAGLVEAEPCDAARLHVNLGWAELVSPRGDALSAEAHSRTAAVAYATGGCPDAPKRQNALVNLALAQWKRGLIREASQTLTDAASMGQTAGWVQAWVLDLSARLALADGKAREALALYEQLRERAQSSETLSAAFRAELGLGQALVALGRLDEAALALERAELALEVDALRVPLGEGRDVFAGDRDESARLLIDVLLRLFRPQDALFVARRARARALRSLSVRSHVSRASDVERQSFEASLAEYRQARDQLQQEDAAAWSLPLSELSAFRERRTAEQSRASAALDRVVQSLSSAQPWQPAPRSEGELVMTFHPLPSGWVAFAHGDAGLRAARIERLPDSTDPNALASVLLLPFEAEIRNAKSLRFITYGSLKEVDFHALPFGEGLLIDVLPVVYGADLGSASSSQPSRRGGLLVVADPIGDLPTARSEGEFLRDRLQGRANLTLLTGDAASYPRVRAHLEAADVFHFAGHAEFEGGGWQSGLLLAESARFEPGDILTLRSVPRYVVLSGCETTRERADVSVASVGLAQAFLSRGAEAVVATMRPVPDAMGLTVSRSLVTTDLFALDAARFRELLLTLRKDPAASEHWASYRMLVR